MDRLFISCCLLIFSCSAIDIVSSAAVEPSKSQGSLSTNSSRNHDLEHDPLVFPTDVPKVETGLNRVILSDRPDFSAPSPCPGGATFCESAGDYPKDFIKNKLKKEPKLLQDILYEEDIGEDIHNKFGPGSGTETELCTSSPKIVYPNKAQSRDGVFEFVVNDDVHKQGIRVETCSNNGAECDSMLAQTLPLGYSSKCVQKYIVRTLVVLNRNSSSDVQGFVTKPFDFPSCCSCVIVNNTNNRFGGAIGTTHANVTARPSTKPIKQKPTTLN